MPAPSTAKETALKIIGELPDETTPAEIVAELYFRQKVNAGLNDLDRQRTLTHDQVKERLAQWLS